MTLAAGDVGNVAEHRNMAQSLTQALRKFVAICADNATCRVRRHRESGIRVCGNGIAKCAVNTTGIINLPVRNIYYYIK